MQINCIAIDDEPLALDKIVSFIEKIDYLNLIKTFVNDYLLKPFSFSRFVQAVEKIYSMLNNINVQKNAVESKADSNLPSKDYVFVKDGYKIVKIILNDILYIEGMKDYLKIKTKINTVHTLLSFKEMEDLLIGDNFIRVHKSYIVAINKIDRIEKNKILIAETKIPIGNTYKKRFFKIIEIFNS